MNISDMKRNAANKLKGYVWYSILVFIIFFGIMICGYLLISLLMKYLGIVGTILSYIILFILSSLASVCIMDHFISIANGTNQKKISKLFRKSNRIRSCLLALILMGLIILAVNLIPMIIMIIQMTKYVEINSFIGELSDASVRKILFVMFQWMGPMMILSLIFSTKLFLVPFLVTSGKKLSAVDCIKESWFLTNDNFWRIIGFQLSFIGWMFLVCFTFFIAGIYVFPYMYTSYAELYRVICIEKRVDYAMVE